jgi:nicotinamide-nucleotide amidase
MRAEVIAIGDELTSGQRLDTNSQWLSERLGELGVPVAFHTTVGDDLEDNVAAFRNAIERTDLVVATGGLGPTADDLTRDAIAAAAGVELVEDAAALAHIKSLFARRRREMPERNRLQAQFPRGTRVVPNPEGTAPGIDLTVSRSCGPPCRVFALPGVPAEMVAMWDATVGPAIAASRPAGRVIRHKRIKCFGVGESDIEARLPDMIRRKREPLVGITVHGATITLRITTSGPSATACEKEMEPTVAQIRDLLGVLVFGEEDDELEDAVVRQLKEHGQSVAVAELGTDGLISHWLAEADSLAFRGGVVADDVERLSALLGDTLHGGAPQQELAAAAAKAVRIKSGAEWGLAAVARDELHVALASADNVRSKQFPLLTHSAIRKSWAAKHALNTLRLALLRTAQ